MQKVRAGWETWTSFYTSHSQPLYPRVHVKQSFLFFFPRPKLFSVWPSWLASVSSPPLPNECPPRPPWCPGVNCKQKKKKKHAFNFTVLNILFHMKYTWSRDHTSWRAGDFACLSWHFNIISAFFSWRSGVWALPFHDVPLLRPLTQPSSG